ncbi:MAG: hypothetical protein NTY98_16860 [Verrucomicrobia bacterium]|nr:hypothetical protein [Verrucomicrobiota bacterium]
MSVYLVTREGQELGTFKTSKIKKGLRTGFFRLSDLGWREASGWQGLFEIAGSALVNSPGANPDGFNPHAAPMANALAAASVVLPPTLIEELADTRPWVRFISVAMGIGCAFMIPACLLMAVDEARSLSPICLLATLLLLYPAVKLSNYATNIASLAKSQSLADMAMALTEQHRFWRFCGIMLLFIVCLGLLLCIGCFFVTRVH